MFNSLIPTDRFLPKAYLGKWYEINRFPVEYTDCPNASAFYELAKDGGRNTIKVTNMCYDKNWRIISAIEGKASLTEKNNELIVSFGPLNIQPVPEESNYIVHAVKYNEWALVGSSSKKTLYILSRMKCLEKDTYDAILSLCVIFGYDISRFVKK